LIEKPAGRPQSKGWQELSIINTPKRYENAAGILKHSGELIREIGSNALILTGEKAFGAAGADLTQSLDENGVSWKKQVHSGPPTQEAVEKYGQKAKENGNDVIVGVGGGRVLDLAKAVGEKQGLPFVTVPTIPATCAAWSALSVLYRADGVQDTYFYLGHSPALVLADKNILLKAPLRAINAGVADTVAKWYELATTLKGNESNFCLRLQLKICELALEFLEQDYLNSYREEEGVTDRSVLENAIDSILLLAGMSGSLEGGVPYGGIAHQFYNNSTKVLETNELMHGERVIFGLVVQFVVESRPEEKIRGYLRGMKRLHLPTTLADLNIREDVDAKVTTISKGVENYLKTQKLFGRTVEAQEIADAIYRVDREGKEAV
jgi:glycerol dehydrogenase-like iron-containing ADH family enzyme